MGRPKKQPQINPKDILPREILSGKIPDYWRYIINELLSYNSSLIERNLKILNDEHSVKTLNDKASVQKINGVDTVKILDNEASFKLLILRVKSWEIALHWLIKKEWDTKHKIPVKKSIANGHKAKGDLLKAIFLLCEKCHSYGGLTSGITRKYSNAACWFGLIFAEFIWHELMTVNEIGNEKKGAKKEQILFERREFIRKHGTLDNPQNPLHKNTHMQATYNLLECSCLLAKQSDVFRDNHWKGYIDALKNEIKLLDTPEFNRVFLEEGKLYIQKSKGRGRILVN